MTGPSNLQPCSRRLYVEVLRKLNIYAIGLERSFQSFRSFKACTDSEAVITHSKIRMFNYTHAHSNMWC